jgi:hypothetical protein
MSAEVEMNQAPFWWVVKFGHFYRSHGRHTKIQREAECHLRRRTAARLAEMEQRAGKPQVRIVKVWARLPQPKLPAWVKPRTLEDRQFAVFDVRSRVVWEYVFQVATVDMVYAVATSLHASDGSYHFGEFTSAPSHVWVEAAARARRVLRDRRRAR